MAEIEASFTLGAEDRCEKHKQNLKEAFRVGKAIIDTKIQEPRSRLETLLKSAQKQFSNLKSPKIRV